MTMVENTEDPFKQGEWQHFTGKQKEVCVDMCYMAHDTIPIPETTYTCNAPDQVRFHKPGNEEETYTIAKQITNNPSDLLNYWYPSSSQLPTLPVTFDEIWTKKKEALEKLGSCLSRSGYGDWSFNLKKLNDIFPVSEMSQSLIHLRAQMAIAFQGGMYNGRAKAFLMALCNFLSDADHIRPYQMFTIPGLSDHIKGTIRYLGNSSFVNNMPVPSEEECRKRKRKSSTSIVSESLTKRRRSEDALSDAVSDAFISPSTSSLTSPKAKANDGPCHLTPAGVLVMLDSLYVTCVFECTRQTAVQALHSTHIQNLRQMLSLMRDQRSIIGCVLNPIGFEIHLAVKNEKDKKLTIHRTMDFNFRMSAAKFGASHEFNTPEFLILAKFLCEAMYINSRRLCSAIAAATYGVYGAYRPVAQSC